MKKKKNTSFVFFILIAVLYGALQPVSARDIGREKVWSGTTELSSVSIRLGAQSGGPGNFLDIFSPNIYKGRKASRYAANIQLMYVFGRTSGANFFFPGSSAIRKYSKSVQEKIDIWSERQEGQMINLGNIREVFEGVNSVSDIRKAYARYRNEVYVKDGYKVAEQGPTDGLNKITEGDVILLHLYGREAFAALKVKEIVPGAGGSIAFDIKYGKSDAGTGGENFVTKTPGEQGDWQVGTTYADTHYQSEYLVGDFPLILSAPHGGGMNPLNIPDRDCPGAVRGTDMRTIELTREIQKILIKEYGVRPHVVVSNLSRRKIDLNREIGPGTCGNAAARPAWQQYHNYLDTAIAVARRDHKRVLLLDIHAHAHTIQRLELGYLINGKAIRDAYRGKDLETLAGTSSLTNIIPENEGSSLHPMLFGAKAFGTLAGNNSIPSVPSQQDPYPKDGEKYLSRGYITQHYTSPDYPEVHGIQVEINRSVRSDGARVEAAKRMAKTIMEYMRSQQLTD
ncbi:N-formylglutamate amidohydrolase [Sinomicrobium soli]|uniref:N-formylglutamate amidohydrolase n=1 Tax=Sinomicrobium sp. N-1-3-6 TaxID=2219864 RepID=UPI000DCE9AFB|nr:N-formylglutamate amidohydrolase [Sinomicrobium sp. N-1-3-6]RAV29650.1 hypothetical protein DN748_05885 [Sinomicrobium sp. N-1-3-6]